MARETLHDRLVAALLRRGETIVTNTRATRYTVLTRTRPQTGEPLGFYYVGRGGALRAGRTVAGSHKVHADVRKQLHGDDG